MSLLERTLHEVAACVRAGLVGPTTVVLWPSAHDADAVAGMRMPPGLRLEHRSGASGARAGGRLLVLAGDLLLGPGALADWLDRAEDVTTRVGLAEVSADDPALASGDVDTLAAGLATRAPREETRPGSGTAPLWMRVGDDLVAARGERRLFASLGKPTDGFAARHLNRPISTRLSRWLTRIGMAPDVWTAALLGLTAISAAVLVRGDLVGFVLGAVLFNAISILDGCDGEMARVRYLETARGARLDTLSDMLSHHVFVVALGIGLGRQPGLTATWQATYFTEGVLTAAGIALALWGAAAVDRGWQQDGHFRDFGTSVLDSAGLSGVQRRIGRVIALATRQDTYHWLWIPVALAGRSALILHAFAIGVIAHLTALVYVWAKSSRAVVSRRGESSRT